MDALLLALVLMLVLEQGSGSQRIAAVSGQALTPRSVTFAIIAIIMGAVFAATVGALIAPLLTGEARLLFLALALGFGAAGLLATGLSAGKMPSVPRPSSLRFALCRLTDNGGFAVSAIALFTGAPLLTATGAILGALGGLAPALLAGRAAGQRPDMRWMCLLAGAAMLIIATWAAASALRLTGQGMS